MNEARSLERNGTSYQMTIWAHKDFNFVFLINANQQMVLSQQCTLVTLAMLHMQQEASLFIIVCQ